MNVVQKSLFLKKIILIFIILKKKQQTTPSFHGQKPNYKKQTQPNALDAIALAPAAKCN